MTELNSFVKLVPASVPAFIGARLIGGAVGLGVLALLFPSAAKAADDAVLPHGGEAVKP